MMPVLILEEPAHPVFTSNGVSRRDAENVLRDHQVIWWDQTVDAMAGAVEGAIVFQHGVVNESFLARYPRLRVLSLGFTGFQDVDQAACARRAIRGYYVPGYSTDSVAELAIGMTLALLRRVVTADRQYRTGVFDSPLPALANQVRPGVELRGKCVAVIGVGEIGTAAARLFHGFGCEVIGVSRRRESNLTGIGRFGSLDEALVQADVITLHRRPEERPVLGSAEFEKIGSRQPVLINVTRTGLVDLTALDEALEARRVSAAGLDITEANLAGPQATAMARLTNRDNVLLTPHIGFTTSEALARLCRESLANAIRGFAGDPTNQITWMS